MRDGFETGLNANLEGDLHDIVCFVPGTIVPGTKAPKLLLRCGAPGTALTYLRCFWSHALRLINKFTS
jgi:hypothetical protein